MQRENKYNTSTGKPSKTYIKKKQKNADELVVQLIMRLTKQSKVRVCMALESCNYDMDNTITSLQNSNLNNNNKAL